MCSYLYLQFKYMIFHIVTCFEVYRCKFLLFLIQLKNGQTLNQSSKKRVYPNCSLPLWTKKACGTNIYWKWCHGFNLFVFSSMVLLFCSSILLDIIVYVIFIISKFCCIPNSHACIMRTSVESPLSNLLNKIDQNQ